MLFARSSDVRAAFCGVISIAFVTRLFHRFALRQILLGSMGSLEVHHRALWHKLFFKALVQFNTDHKFVPMCVHKYKIY